MFSPRMCKVRHDPPRSYGDCIRACIASMVDQEDVPHVFGDRMPSESWSELREYLKTIGCGVMLGAFADDPRQHMKEANPGVYYMMICTCGGEDHAVVCKDDEVVHDPNWYRKQITGPASSGAYVIAVVTVLP